jgi:transaldolase
MNWRKSMVDASSSLRLYVDSAEEKDWRHYLPTGIFYGVTTNPKLLNQTGIGFTIDRLAILAQTAFELGANEIHLQVWGRETEQMLRIGRELVGIDERVMVKVPITPAGILCARQLISEGSYVTLTAVHSARQALIAIALGAKYAAPYLGRMTDGGLNGIEEVTSMVRIIAAMDSPLRLLVASIRQTAELKTLAERGLNTFTLLPKIIDELLENELTRQAYISFEEAVKKGK